MFKLLKNKKGFTLVELIATVAIMAIVAGIAVPSIYVTTAKKQRSAAESDLQQLYRSSISCISDLASRYIIPNAPYDRFDSSIDDEYKEKEGNEILLNIGTGNNVWYVEFEKQLVKKLYNTILALDITVCYYYPSQMSTTALNEGSDKTRDKDWLRKPLNCNASERSTFVTAGNKDPYIVVQVVRIYQSDDATDYENYLIVSYHNKANPFSYTSAVATKTVVSNGVSTRVPDLTAFNAYETNKGNDIAFSYRIR